VEKIPSSIEAFVTERPLPPPSFSRIQTCDELLAPSPSWYPEKRRLHLYTTKKVHFVLNTTETICSNARFFQNRVQMYPAPTKGVGIL